MLQKIPRLILRSGLVKKINPQRLALNRRTSFDVPDSQISNTSSFKKNPALKRHLSCPTCWGLTQSRSIHHPTTFKETVKKPFEWGYGSHNGPDQWHYDFPVALDGKRQSPIDISTHDCETDPSLMENQLQWKYSADMNLFIENTGRSWTVMVDGSTSGLNGGPLDSEYELWQYHAHWGDTNDHGSEHTVDGKSYPAELHLVHWNSAKYRSPEEAVSKPDGLAVLGLFLQVTENHHEEFAKVSDLMQMIKYKDMKLDIEDPIDVAKFLPDSEADKTFWTYPGSLTTPPLLECVTWILFKNPMNISQEQLDAMRSLFFSSTEEVENGEIEQMVNNYRHTRPLGERKLRQF